MNPLYMEMWIVAYVIAEPFKGHRSSPHKLVARYELRIVRAFDKIAPLMSWQLPCTWDCYLAKTRKYAWNLTTNLIWQQRLILPKTSQKLCSSLLQVTQASTNLPFGTGSVQALQPTHLNQLDPKSTLCTPFSPQVTPRNGSLQHSR